MCGKLSYEKENGGARMLPSGMSAKHGRFKGKVVSNGTIYAIAWVVYVLIGSAMFLLLEQTTEYQTVDYGSWAKFKGFWYGKDEISDDLFHLQVELHYICPHQLFNLSINDMIEARNQSKLLFWNATDLNPDLNDKNGTLDLIEMAEEDCREYLVQKKELIIHSRWGYIDAIYYTMTLVTTIGFGHIAPSTRIGQVFSVICALIGVPLTCILMSKNSTMLSTKMFRLYADLKGRSNKSPEVVLYSVTGAFLFLGFSVFMVIPSFFFAHLEEWSYTEAFYFTFITVSTIGFGDYIAGYNQPVKYQSLYKFGIVVWIMTALGYWILLLNFLQKSIQYNTKILRKQLRNKKWRKRARSFKKHIKKYSAFRSTGPKDEEKLHALAGLVEKIYNSNIHCIGEMRTNSSFTKRPSELKLHNIDSDDTDDYDSEDDPNMIEQNQCDFAFSLEEFLNTNVVLPGEGLPGVDKALAFVASDEQETLDNGQNGARGSMEVSIRDIVALTLLVSSSNDVETSTGMDTTSEDSVNIVGQVSPVRETMPLLKDILENVLEKTEEEDEKCNDTVLTIT